MEVHIPALNPRIPATTLRRLWTMLAHIQGELPDQSKLPSALASSGQTVSHKIDLLCDRILLRCLPAWSCNVGKRLIDTLLGLSTLNAVLSHPVAGSNRQGFVIEPLIAAAPTAQVRFFRTNNGAEVNLELEFCNGESWAIEIKRSSASTVSDGFVAAADLDASRKLLVALVIQAYPMKDGIEVMYPLMAALAVASQT